MDMVRRKLTLVTFGTYRVKTKIFHFAASLFKTRGLIQ